MKVKWVATTLFEVCGGSDDEDGEEGAGPVGDYEDDEDEDEEDEEEESESGEVGLSYLMKDDIQVMNLLNSLCSFETYKKKWTGTNMEKVPYFVTRFRKWSWYIYHYT